MTDLAAKEWRFIAEQSAPGPLQMAFDETAAETVADGGPRTVRVYRWEPSTFSLGYRQEAKTVDWEYCEAEGVTVTRRQTGGGGIYHDSFGDISYSIVVPADEVPGDLLSCYELLCKPLLEFFDRLGLAADFAESEQPSIYEPACYLRGIHPAHDILCNGRKISGNAQYRTRDAVVQHGSISVRTRPERHLAVFKEHNLSHEVFTKRVTGIMEETDQQLDRETIVSTLERTLADWVDASSGDWTDSERSRAETIAAEKYATNSWVKDRERNTAAER